MQIPKSQTQSQPQPYKFYSYFKKHPLKAIDIALTDQQLRDNEVILQCGAHIRRTGFRIFRDMTLLMLAIKVGTKVAHYRRSLALSGPRNVPNAIIKYLVVPGLVTYYMEYDRYRDLMLSVETLKNKEIEERYREILEQQKKKKKKGLS